MKFKFSLLSLLGLMTVFNMSANTNMQSDSITIQKPVVKDSPMKTYDIVYKVVPQTGRELSMSIIVPSNIKEPMPLIVLYPGGGFTTADYHKYLPMRLAFAQRGYVVASPGYRTVPDRYPALIEDAKAAMRYLRANAKAYNIDTSRVGVVGCSAGGYVSNMMGATIGEEQYAVGDNLNMSDEVNAVASLYGISNLTNIGEGLGSVIEDIHKSPAASEALLINGVAFPPNNPGGSILSDVDKAIKASPVGHIKKDMPPFLLMAGTEDFIVSPVQTKQWYDALKASGNEVRLIMVEGAGHGNDPIWSQPEIINIVIDFFDGRIKKD